MQKSEYGPVTWALVAVCKFVLTYHHGSPVGGLLSYLSFSWNETFCCYLMEIARISTTLIPAFFLPRSQPIYSVCVHFQNLLRVLPFVRKTKFLTSKLQPKQIAFSLFQWVLELKHCRRARRPSSSGENP